MIEYKGFIGHFTFDDKSNIFIGKVANSQDLITFQGKSLSETKDAFRDSVNSYIDWCKKYRKSPEKIPISE